MTLYQLHVRDWINCTRCQLHETRKRVVLARGTLPCDVLFVGEAPGECITGDTLIDTAYRDKRIYPDGIPVMELVGQSGFKVYSFDTETRRLALGTVKKVWKTGYKNVFKVSFYWWGAPPNGKGGRHKYYGSIRVTENHPFLLKTGEYRSISQGLEVGNRLQPFYRFTSARRSKVGIHSGAMRREAVLLLEDKIGRSLQEGEQAHHDDRNPENDTQDNLVLLDIVEHARLHGLEDNAMFNPTHRESHRLSMSSKEYREGQSRTMREHLANPEARKKRITQILAQREQTSETVRTKFATDPVYYYRYLKGKRFRNGVGYTEERIRQKMQERFPDEPYPPSDDNHIIFKIEPAGKAAVYDMEVEKYHNFAANGIFVHNSEDVIGKPFCGPAGRLLDKIIAVSVPMDWAEDPKGTAPGEEYPRYTHALTNLVGCIPREGSKKAGEPDHDCIMACRPRLEELIRIAQPRLIVRVGKLAKEYLDQGYKHSVKVPDGIEMVDIIHPSAILRANIAQRGLLCQKAVVTLSNALEAL